MLAAPHSESMKDGIHEALIVPCFHASKGSSLVASITPIKTTGPNATPVIISLTQ